MTDDAKINPEGLTPATLLVHQSRGRDPFTGAATGLMSQTIKQSAPARTRRRGCAGW
jgi:hypothetical protein